MAIGENIDYTIRIVEGIPSKVKCWIVEDEVGYYNIYANAKLSKEEMTTSIQHELEHILHDDLRSGADADSIEASRHFATHLF